MTEKEITISKARLSSREDGELRNLFYKKNGLPKQVLLTNRQIFSKLEISEYNPNSLEDQGFMKILSASLAYLRSQAKLSNLAWIDLEIGNGGRGSIAKHGFSNDIVQIMSNANKFDTIAEKHKVISKKTRHIAKIAEKLLV